MLIFALGRRLKKVRLNVAKPGVKIGALMPLHTVCGMGTILFVACATATNRAFLHPTSAPSAFQFIPPPLCSCDKLFVSSTTLCQKVSLQLQQDRKISSATEVNKKKIPKLKKISIKSFPVSLDSLENSR